MRVIEVSSALARGASICAAFFASASVFGAERVAPLITRSDPIALPGMGRVLLGFLVTVALAVIGVYALRRWLPRFAIKTTTVLPANLTVHSIVHQGMRFHVATVAGQTILVAEGKTGIAMTVVPPTEKNTIAPIS